jgi:membrane protease YdiL (CAAX protease family)
MKSNPIKDSHISEGTPSTHPELALPHVAILMLSIGTVWRLMDIFVFGLGGSEFNVMPSKLGPLLIILGYFWVYRRYEFGSVLGLSARDWRIQLPIGIFTGLIIVMGIDMLSVVLYAVFLNPAYPLNISIVGPFLLLYMFVFFAINAIFEEVLFRGLLQNSLMRFLSPGRAILLSSLIFGVWHACWPFANGLEGITLITEIIKMVAFSAVIGAFFGLYYHSFSKEKTLLGTISAHTMLNLVNEGFKLGPEPTAQGPDFSFVDPNLMIVTFLLFGIVFSLLFLMVKTFDIEMIKSRLLEEFP